MRLIGEDRVWKFGEDAEFELHEDGCFIRTADEARVGVTRTKSHYECIRVFSERPRAS
jgi:hypothetical protein